MEVPSNSNEQSGNKRKANDSTETALVVKKPKLDESGALKTIDSTNKQIQEFKRTSNLMAPIMLLTGHKAEVLSLKFGNKGKYILSGSFDKSIFLWEVYGECKNVLAMNGHKNAVTEVAWSSSDERFFSSSADKTVASWDTETGKRLKKYKQHTSVVNCVSASFGRDSEFIVSGGDDCSVKLWDIREKKSARHLHNISPVTSVSFSKDNSQIFAAGVDNLVRVWDLRKDQISIKLEGHEEGITGIRLAPDGNHLLTNSMDNTVRIWDVRPFCPTQRCLKIFQGAQHNFEKNLLRCAWSSDGNRITAGSADRFVYVWETATRRILYKLPGHKGSVNETGFHPLEPIIGSCGSDHNIYLGEIKP